MNLYADWEVLEHIVRTLRENLHWKTYVLAFSDGKMDRMASRVCRMVTQDGLLFSFWTRDNFTFTAFYAIMMCWFYFMTRFPLWYFQVYDTSLNYPSCLTFIPEPLSRSTFESTLHPLLAYLVGHHQYLHSTTQQKVKSEEHFVV